MSRWGTALGLLALAVGCGGDPDDVEVRIYAANVDEVARVEVSVIDACRDVGELGEPVSGAIRTVEALARDHAPIGRLEPGSYALYARAWRSGCVLFAAGCDSFRIPDDDSIVDVALSIIPTTGCDEGAECVDDVCQP